MKKKIMLLALVLFAAAGCKEKKVYPAAEYMAFEQVEFVDDFPMNETLSGGELLDLGLLGALDVRVHDSLLILTTQDNMGQWSFFALPETRPLGKYLVRGRGPNEFLSLPWVSDADFFTDGGEQMASIYNFDSGKLLYMNMTRTLRDGVLSMTEAASLEPSLFTVRRVDGKTIFCEAMNDREGREERSIVGDTTHREALEMLNSAKVGYDVEDGVTDMDNINVIGKHTIVKPGARRVVETGLLLNRLNIYDLEGDFRKTVCVGAADLESIAEVCRIDRRERTWVYSITRAYPDFFVVLNTNYASLDEMLGTVPSPMPALLFFDWEGKPLARITADRRFATYDIDLKTGMLYTLNDGTEEVFRYDIGAVLGAL